MSAATQVTAAEFEAQVVNSTLPVLIDFYAPWCGPCRMMAPVLDQVAQKLQGRAKVVKVNVEDEPELAAAFKVSSIPLLVVMHQGKVMDHVLGAVPASQLLGMLEKVLGRAVQP